MIRLYKKIKSYFCTHYYHLLNKEVGTNEKLDILYWIYTAKCQKCDKVKVTRIDKSNNFISPHESI
jgi:RNase P subunit RPR2